MVVLCILYMYVCVCVYIYIYIYVFMVSKHVCMYVRVRQARVVRMHMRVRAKCISELHAFLSHTHVAYQWSHSPNTRLVLQNTCVYDVSHVCIHDLTGA
jgi:hypothetical protein